MVSNFIDYFKFLSTTKLNLDELNEIIRSSEEGMQHDNWEVRIIGKRNNIRKIRLVLDKYPNGEDNGGNGNGIL